MHLRDGKVLGAPTTNPRTMPDLKKSSESKFVEIKEARKPIDPPMIPIDVGVQEKAPVSIMEPIYNEHAMMLQKRVDTLETQVSLLIQLHIQSKQVVAPNALRYEDGQNISRFLSVYEVDCLEDKIPADMWGIKIRRHLTGDALDYYLQLRRADIDLRQWEIVRTRLQQRFCRETRENVLAKLHTNVWSGDHALYITRFAQAVTRAVSFSPDELVKLFLAKLPLDIKLRLTRDGTIRYHDWEDASTALSKLAEPICAIEAEDRQCLQNMEEAFKKVQARRPPFGAAGVQSNSRVFRCRECQGIGHRDVYCPLRKTGFERKPGVTCVRCGGKEHNVKDCATRPTRPQSNTPSNTQTTNASGKVLMMTSSESSVANLGDQQYLQLSEETPNLSEQQYLPLNEEA